MTRGAKMSLKLAHHCVLRIWWSSNEIKSSKPNRALKHCISFPKKLVFPVVNNIQKKGFSGLDKTRLQTLVWLLLGCFWSSLSYNAVVLMLNFCVITGDNLLGTSTMMRTVIRLWLHECCRIFADRMMSLDDKTWVSDLVMSTLKKNFCQGIKVQLNEDTSIKALDISDIFLRLSYDDWNQIMSI